MNVKLRILAFIFLQLIPHFGTAQNNELKFNLVEGNNGQHLGKVNAISQDPLGYLWFASPGDKCVYRYDGNRMIAFRHQDSNPNSLGIIHPETVLADDAGMIWIAGEGLDEYNPATGIFKHYRHTQNDKGSLTDNGINAILKDRKGRLWVGTGNGLDCLDEKTGKFTHYRNEPGNGKSLSSNVAWRIYEDHQGVIWVGTGWPWFKKDPEDGGLNRLEPDGTFTRFMHDPNNPHSLINNKVAAMYEDSRGVFWVGTSGDGLHTLDRKTGQFERHLYNTKAPDQLSSPPLRPGAVNDKITFIKEDGMGAIWIGTMYSGINRYDTGTKKITHYEGSNGFPDSTSWNAFTSRDGELWITTENANLYRTNPFHKSINSVPAVDLPNHFMEDNEGYLWVGTRGNGLYKYDQHKNLIGHFKHDPLDSFSLQNDNVGPVFQNQENTIWVGTDNGVRILNQVTNKFSRFADGGNLKDSTGVGVAEIFQDKQGIMWFGRWGLGLVSYNPKDHSYKHFLSNATDSTSLSSNSINTLFEDKSGLLWVAGLGGINRLNRETGRFKHYLQGTFITGLYQDSEATLWAGTEKGLFLYNQKEDRFTNFFDPQSEINSLTLGGIIEDDAKNLWLISPSAIIKLNLVTKETFIYGSRFGITPNSMQPWTSSFKNGKGQLLFGYDNGFYTFFPEELAVKPNFKIIITDFFINTFPILPGKGSPIQEPVEEISDIDLKYNQNNIAFNFAAIDYREPEATKYFFMLENYDREWQEVKDKKEKASYYFNLPPGKYVYRVKAFNTDGTKAEKQITIHINPPWWQTWWAYCVYALLLLAGIFALYRYQKQRIIHIERQKRQHFELAQAKEIEKAYTELKSTQALLIQSEKMASLGELTAGIAHEIQNPLNFVNNFSELSNELIEELNIEIDKGNNDEVKAIANDIKQNLERINHHGKRADAIVKGMLQHSQTSTGKKEPTNINKLADEYLRLSYHGLRAKDKSFNATLKTDFDETIGKINIIPQDIGRVILNLINNAFYAVAERKKQQSAVEADYEPTVSVSTSHSLPMGPVGRGKVNIKVSDNGNGIPQKIADKIFHPFFTTKPTGQGTGLGLSLSYDIVKAHGGEIKVESRESEGTIICIVLPI